MANFIYDWRSSKALPGYTARWYITPLSMAFGITIPLRKPFAEEIGARSELKVDKGTEASRLTAIEGHVLKEFIIDGAQNFGDIDRKYDLGSGRSNYAFYKLEERGIIERITVTMTPPGLKYNSIFITQTNNYKEVARSRDEWFKDTITFDIPILNKDAFRGDMGIPDSIFYIRPIFDETNFHKTKEKLGLIKGTETECMVITNVIIGSLCYRNFDPTYTETYKNLLKQGKVRLIESVDY
jgi:DNA-binding Lrp family transcriptional regulator